MKQTVTAVAALLLISGAAQAGEKTRGLGAHEHGRGSLSMAMENGLVAMEFAAPGADIVGFEYAASSDEDLAAIEAAKETLTDPLALFAPTAAAGCAVVKSDVVLIGEGGDHGDHGHEEHGHEEHGHEEHGHEEHGHDDHGHDDHGHEEHAEAKHDHDEHDHEEHAEKKHGHDDHAHDDHGHDEHGHDEQAEGGHSEFRAEYQMTCETPDALAGVAFPYFERFPNAEALTVTVIGAEGARRFDATREDPVIDLAGVL